MHGYFKPFTDALCLIAGNISKPSNHGSTPTPVRRAGPNGVGPACPRVRSSCYCTARRALIRPLPGIGIRTGLEDVGGGLLDDGLQLGRLHFAVLASGAFDPQGDFVPLADLDRNGIRHSGEHVVETHPFLLGSLRCSPMSRQKLTLNKEAISEYPPYSTAFCRRLIPASSWKIAGSSFEDTPSIRPARVSPGFPRSAVRSTPCFESAPIAHRSTMNPISDTPPKAWHRE